MPEIKRNHLETRFGMRVCPDDPKLVIVFAESTGEIIYRGPQADVEARNEAIACWRGQIPCAPISPREALVRARSALATALRDTAPDLAKPERASVLNRRIQEITQALRGMPDA